MLIYRILLGLLGLGIVVFVHELGHFIAARLMGIGVEAFSIGWGKPILKKKIGEVEYRLGLFPLGGYCKMKGVSDHEFSYNKVEESLTEKGGYFSAHPFRRIVTCFGGPLFNLVFAILVLSVIWGIGFEVNAMDNRIILVSEVVPGSFNPADEAGLKSGDRIVSIMGRSTETHREIMGIISANPEQNLPMTIERNGQILELSVRPALDRSSGAGRIGIHFWTDPVIERIAAGSPAEMAGLRSGDIILTVNGAELPHTIALSLILERRPPLLNLEVQRGAEVVTASLIPIYDEAGPRSLGIEWEAIRFQTPRLSLPGALARGSIEAWNTFSLSVRSLTLLFRGVDLTQAVAGPGRITYMIGDIAAEGFAQSFGAGISSMASFLALISIALAIMNLLPLPVLDGGMILLFLAEVIRRKPLPARFVSIFQTVGVVMIGSLLLFAVFGDIMFFSRR